LLLDFLCRRQQFVDFLGQMTVAPEPIASAGGDIAPLIQIKRSQRGALLNLNRIRLNRSSPGDMKLIGCSGLQ
jgi:hypothetical protein